MPSMPSMPSEVTVVRDASRHRLYFDLLDSFRQPGCPICRLGSRTATRYLDILAYENVNDPGEREKLRAARGFCNYHAYRFLEEMKDLLAVGIIYRDVVHTVVLALSDGESPLAQGVRSLLHPDSGDLCEDHGLARLISPTRPCPACQALADGAADRLHAFLEHLPEEDFRAAYEQSDGLCYPHFREALGEVGDDGALRLLVESALGRLARPLDQAPDGAVAASAGLVGSAFGERGAISRENQASQVFGRARGKRVRSDETRQEAGASARPDPDSCPVCRRIEAPAMRVVEEFGREISTDHERGGEQLESVCNRHAWQLVRVSGDELLPALAVLSKRRRAQVSALAPKILAAEGEKSGLELPVELPGRPSRTRRAGRELAHALSPRTPCPLCERQDELEQAELLRFVSGLAEVDGQDGREGREEQVETICIPHLVHSCHLSCHLRLSAAERERLVRREVQGWTDLVAELKEYIRKVDFRFRDEPRGHEQTSPYHAVEQMVGRRGIR